MKKYLVTILLTSLLLVGCNNGEKIKNPPSVGSDIEVPSFMWKLRSQHDLETIYKTNGQILTDDDRLYGFVGIASDGRYVIYTAEPRYVDDEVSCTLGHEVMHLVLGDYHSNREDN